MDMGYGSAAAVILFLIIFALSAVRELAGCLLYTSSEYYKNVRDAIDGKAELIVQPWQVRKVLKVIEAAFQSAETGNLVSLRD